MTCATAEDLMVRVLAGSLPERQRTAFERHLEACDGCRVRLREFRSGTALLSQIDELPSPTGLAQAALRTYAAERATRAPLVVTRARVLIPALAAVVLVVVFLMDRLRPPSQQAGGVSTPGTSAPSPRERGHGPAQVRRQPGVVPQPRSRVPDPRLVRTAPRAPVQAPEPRRASVGDLDYLDGYDPRLAGRWVGGGAEGEALRRAFERRLSRVEVKDDFVEIPYPRFAAVDVKGTATGEAIRKFEKEAQVVDARLFRKVSLRLRQTPLSDLCASLRQQTGISFVAARSVSDENVTLFVKELPAREVMRAVARLFGYKWGRAGEEPAYRYELRQDLRAQIAEEELRSRQVNEALLELDGKLEAFRPYLELGPEEIQRRLEHAQPPEKFLLRDLSTWEWGAVQLYHRLTPAQRQTLASGERLQFRTDARSPELRLPAEWRDLLLQRTGFVVGTVGGQQYLASPEFFSGPNGPGVTSPLVGQPGAEVEILLGIEGLQQGKLVLEAFARAYLLKPDGSDAALSGSKGGVLASAQSPGTARARNAALNAGLRADALLRPLVSIRPKPSCPWFTPESRPKRFSGARVQLEPRGERLYLDVEGQIQSGEEPPHVTSADVWEAVHDATGAPVVADAYSRLFEAKGMEVEQMSRFEALCRLGDRMGVRWQRDGQFLMGRSVTYLWDKVKEVPARHLRRWRADYDEQGFLPLDDLLEAATLPDRHLESAAIGQVIGHCWGLEDWIVIGEGASLPLGINGPRVTRPYARFLALLSSGQRASAQRQGLSFEELLPAQQQALIELLGKDRRSPREVVGVRFRVDYAPAGTFVWYPAARTKSEVERLERTVPFATGKTAEETLAAARRAYPQAQAGQVKRSHGILAFTFTNPATGAAWKAGWVGVEMEIDSRRQ